MYLIHTTQINWTLTHADIKAYDSVTGADVTAKFDIKVENGTITATSKDEFIKDKVNNPVIDTTGAVYGSQETRFNLSNT